MAAPPGPIRISIQSSPFHLPVVRGAVRQMCLLLGFDESGADKAVAAVDEALANVIAHAYDGRPGEPIEVTLAPLGDGGRTGLEVQVVDQGRAVAAGEIRGRDLEDIRPGGLGTHIMECCMDVVKFDHPPAGGTRLRMVKYLSDPAGAAGNADPGELCDR